MHKKLILLLLLFLCASCSSNNIKESESIKIYESYIDAVINNQGIDSAVIPFDYKMNVMKQSDGTYQYEIVISNPRVAMYDITAIAVDQTVDSNNNVFPCLGLLGDDVDQQFNMIPYQANGQKGFIRMFSLDATTKESQFSVNVMVTWKDSTLRNTSRVFFTCNYVEEAKSSMNISEMDEADS